MIQIHFLVCWRLLLRVIIMAFCHPFPPSTPKSFSQSDLFTPTASQQKTLYVSSPKMRSATRHCSLENGTCCVLKSQPPSLEAAIPTMWVPTALRWLRSPFSPPDSIWRDMQEPCLQLFTVSNSYVLIGVKISSVGLLFHGATFGPSEATKLLCMNALRRNCVTAHVLHAYHPHAWVFHQLSSQKATKLQYKHRIMLKCIYKCI